MDCSPDGRAQQRGGGLMKPGDANQETKDFEDAVFALLRLSMADRIRALGESDKRDQLKYRWIGEDPS
jgi:hypothetical protein